MERSDHIRNVIQALQGVAGELGIRGEDVNRWLRAGVGGAGPAPSSKPFRIREHSEPHPPTTPGGGGGAPWKRRGGMSSS